MAGIHKAIQGAIANQKPARYGFGTGESYINTNRDQLFEDCLRAAELRRIFRQDSCGHEI